MSARAYTMKEMRAIVDYLVERKAFSEIRGRKMWMDYASSGLTSRTWQSLKETFLKRILPDIHNPYYKLSPETIRSFREGKDVANKIRNKLQFRNSVDGIDEAADVKPSTSGSGGQVQTGTGEDNIHSNLTSDRESTETIILKTTEDEKDGDSEDDQEDGSQNDNTRTKSLRDCITFTEPLTPMLQEILHDFDSDEDQDDLIIDKDNLKEKHNQEPNSDKSDKKEEVLIKDKKKVQSTESLNDKEKAQESKISNDASNKTKPSVTIHVTTKNITSSKADDSPSKANKSVVELRNKNLKSDEDNVMSSDDFQKKTETKVNGVNANPSTSAETQKRNLRKRKSSQILEESQSTTTDPHKSDINNSVPDSLLPNNQEGLLNTLNVTEDPKQIETLSNQQEKPKLSPKAPKKTKSSPNVKEKTKKKFKTTLKKKKEPAEPIENTEIDKDREQEIPKPGDTQIDGDDCIILIDSENNNNGTASGDKVENDIPNNIDESESKVPNKPAPEPEPEHDTVNQEDVIAKKDDAISVDVQATQSQLLSNPCLQSVSLYEENLQENSSNESDLLQADISKKNSPTKAVAPEEEAILLLASDSNPVDVQVQSPAKANNIKMKRKRLLNNLFRKSNDSVKHKRRRYNSQRSNAPPIKQTSSDSSEWSSTDSDCEFVSPPRSRGRTSKKYLKPKSSRLLSLEQDGGLFVACGKKIYPLIDDSKGTKTFVSYIPEDDSEEEEVNYWKLKYIEERKKTAELTKLFEEVQSGRQKKRLTLQGNSPILQSKTYKINNGVVDNSADEEDDKASKIIVAKQIEKTEVIRDEEKTVKIKYAKNNEEISLEGQWPNVQVILKDVMQLIHKDRQTDDVIVAAAKPAEIPAPAPPPVIVSGSTTPDEEVRRKVNDLENSILQEIEKRDKLEEINEVKPVKNNKCKPKKRPAPAALQTAIEPKTRRSKQKLETANADNKSDSEIIVNEAKLKPIEPEVASNSVQKSGGSLKAAVQNEKSNQNVSKDVINDEDSEILYKFPSPKRTTPDTETMIVDDENYKNAKKSSLMRLLVPLSEESSLGYQDSDGGPVFEMSKKKKPLSTIGYRNKSRRNNERKAYECSNSDASNECSMSLPSAPQNSTKIDNFSLNTEAYRSESYQILIPMAKRIDSVVDRIQKANPCPNEMDSIADTNSLHLSPASQNFDSKQDKSSSSISMHLNTEPASSSSVSLPLSPELSIVENISLSKSNINMGEHPTINEIQANEDSLSLTCEQFALSHVDVTMPLMEQECLLRMSANKSRFPEIDCEPTNSKTFENTFVDGDDKNFDLDVNANKRCNTVSETLLNKLDTVSIGDNPSFVNSLDDHMKNLLLESAKKAKPIRKSMRGKENIDEVMEVDNADNKNKTKQKKRCSTPRKRQNIVTSQPLLVDGVIEEETMESCASGRKSCPAVFSTIEDDLNKNTDTKSKSPDHVTVRKPKKPKQIIKVKILRPKPKKSLTKAGYAENGRFSKQSVRTDSGINDTTCSRSLNLNETVEFIHNHSETCLQASECLDSNSLQILSPSRSIISLTTSSLELDDGLDQVSILSRESSGLPPEMFCSDARDGSIAMKANIEANKPPSQNSANEFYHTPPASVSSLNSLITEDLSDERPSKARGDWFLLSDEDATTTVSNLVPAPNTVDNSIYSAYLKRLFPVTCAIPDLSTITEASKDTDSQSRQNPTSNTTEYNNLLCSEHLSDEEFISCQS